MEDEDVVFLTLKCADCENTDCRKSTYPIESKGKTKGCTRKVSESLYEKYCYYTAEILPFLYMDTKRSYQNRVYREFIQLCEQVYSCPLGRMVKIAC